MSIDNDTRAMIYGEYMQGAVKGERISSSLTLVGDWVWVLSLMESFIKENPVSPVNSDIITDMK